MQQDGKTIQEPKRDRRDDKHVHRGNGIGMIAKECLPALRRWPPSLRHILCHRGLAEIDAKLEQLAVDPWCSPQWVRDTHLANELNTAPCSLVERPSIGMNFRITPT